MISHALTVLLATAATFDVRDFGAAGDGVAKDTAAIQKAIDAAAAAGGGEVRVPKGRYLTGSLFLRSNVDFNVAKGATIEASREPADYNAADICPQNEVFPEENISGGHLFLAIGQTNVTLRGEGVITGSGLYFFTNGFDRARIGATGVNGLGIRNEQDAIKWRPAQMIYFVESDGVRLEGLEITDAPYWSVFIHGCTHVVAKDLYIHTSRHPHVYNGDGLNFDCCRHVRVSGCRIDTADDSLCLRANGKKLLRTPPETSDVIVRDCTLSSSAEAIRIGVGEGVVRDCSFSDLVIRNSNRGINFASTWFPSRGVDFIGIAFSNVTAECASSFLCVHRLKSRDPDVRNLSFVDCRVKQGRDSYLWSRKGKPFEDVVFRNCTIDRELEAVNVRGLKIEGGDVKMKKLSKDAYEKLCQELDRCEESIW